MSLGRSVGWAILVLGIGGTTWGQSSTSDQPGQANQPNTQELEERVRNLEAMLQSLSSPSVAPSPPSPTPPLPQEPGNPVGAGSRTGDAPESADATEPSGSVGATGDGPGPNMPAAPLNFPLAPTFGRGFRLATPDQEYSIEFHSLIQPEGRFLEQGGQDDVNDTFAFPRAWFILNGTLTKPFEYWFSIANLASDLNTYGLLDMFVNVHFDDRLQFKFGRYKTPFTYEFYAEPINGLINPERSLFFNNFALNRDVGAMGWGTVLDKRLDYAVGIFNGSANTATDLNDAKTLAAFLNYRPFAGSGEEWLENFQFGGSVEYGRQNEFARPRVLRLLTAIPGNAVAGVPFLAFEDTVREEGPRLFWDPHVAYYAGPLSFVAEYSTGSAIYQKDNRSPRTRVDVESFYVQSGVFVTGETVTGRGALRPNHNFDLRPGKRGWGALELFGRYNLLDLGDNVFGAGLSNPDNWTDHVQTIDLGFNWYLNQYLKVIFQWEHAMFEDPVLFNVQRDAHQLTSDSFVFRFQVYF